ncbi:MAG: patatin-like phospholipase family protein, partial [Candidatus Competibacteraceae bacterium]|nr:patatin-like phospholipase family protein [Candidatus Competibacteraceae bacterium]
EMVVLREGSLARAMRASMAVPGLMAPAEIGERLLVDGGLVRNLPVDVVRELCADVIIAVNLGTPLLDREALDTAVGVTLQMINILTEQNVQTQLAALGQRDILISPELGNITAADFHRAAEAVEDGERAARNQAGSLAALALEPAAYRAWQAKRRQQPSPPPVVDRLVVESLERVNPAVVEEALTVEPGEPLDEDTLQQDLIRLYGRGDFERLDYRLFTADGQRVLAIQPIEKSWGPGYLRFGLGLSTDFEGTQAFALQAGYDRTWVNALGGAWRNDLQIGRTSLLRSAFHQPLTPVGNWFVEPWLSLERYPVNIYQQGDLVAQYQAKRWNLGLDLGRQLGGGSELRLGILTGQATAEVDVGTLSLPEPDFQEGAITARLRYDRLDDAFFPRSGSALSLDAYHSRTELGAGQDYTRLEARWLTAASRGRDAWHWLFWLGSGLEEELPVFDQFSLGGFLRLSGYRTDRWLGGNAGFGRLVYYRRVDTLPATAGGAVYLGSSLEAGRVWEGRFEPDDDEWRYSASLFVGAQTFLGPLYLGYGRAVAGEDALYLYIGQP